MNEENAKYFFDLRKQAKTYISKVFSFNSVNVENVRNITIVLEGNDQLQLGEIEGAMCLRLTGEKRKTQVTAVVTQDDKKIRRLTLQTFQSRAGDWLQSTDKNEFTFRSDEFERLQTFLQQIEFINLSNLQNFHIEDVSNSDGPKTIVDAMDHQVVKQIQSMTAEQRNSVMENIHGTLTKNDINTLLGRKQGLKQYEDQIEIGLWGEVDWQDYFERESWVFGYGLDYRIMRQFSREAVVGAGGTDNRNKPTVDFLMRFTDYTVLVEIKKPDTKIFKPTRGGRAGTWEFSAEFVGAVSQILEQKAEWLSFAQTGEHFDKSGDNILRTRTRNVKSILVIGTHSEFINATNQREGNIMRDTFELFRRENRTIEIVTFDELLERAQFITKS